MHLMIKRKSNDQNSMYLEIEQSFTDKYNQPALIYSARVRKSIHYHIVVPSILLIYYLFYLLAMNVKHEDFYQYYVFCNVFFSAIMIGNGLNNYRYIDKVSRLNANTLFQSFMTASITSMVPFMVYVMILVKSDAVNTLFNDGNGFPILMNIISIALWLLFNIVIGKFYYDYKDHLSRINSNED